MQFRSQLALHVHAPVPFGIDRELGYTLADDDLGTPTAVEVPDDASWMVRHHDRRIADRFMPVLVDELVANHVPGLSLAGCRDLTADGFARLAHCHGLRALELFHSSADDDAMSAVASLAELESLRLAGTAISLAGIRKLASLPNLRELDLGFTRTGDAALEVIATFPSLRSLTLQHTDVTDVGLAALGATRLDALCLQGTAIGDRGVGELRALAGRLQRLHLGYTQVTDACVPALLALRELRILMLRATTLSSAAHATIARGLPYLSSSADPADGAGLIL